MRQKEKKKKPGKLRSILETVLMVLFFAAGIGLMVYPHFSDWWNDLHQSKAIATYERATRNLSAEEKQAMWDKACKFNEELLSFPDRYHMTDDEMAEYESTLDVSGTGIMGYIEIKEQNIYLPIYHDTSEGVLQIATGHLAGSSLPVTTDTMHCVITGHTGLPSAELFTNIDRMKEGDTFKLIVLGRVITYEVDQISVVLPNEVQNLQIEDGKNYCTLVTCTPYGINTHRLLVRGKWVSTELEKDADGEPSIDVSDGAVNRMNLMLASPYIAAGAAFLVCIVLAVRAVRKGKRNKTGKAHATGHPHEGG
ncbi:MAG: class C sortase [Lachnospiraceae bacterium]|nr:class C sortase [Lachnospiraceae bacterium]MCH4063509.1 class C sortase [Lachnospiraceae bacterium]MCH4104657.1 class C sortase [Lachnospiraceae bacterium]MCI1310064.1 class C sortase [Lachnospiraceae bacterium]MCI1358628.1 class C sortase [Lachnospiraceae bacterium]